jgi:hypothetical protein
MHPVGDPGRLIVNMKWTVVQASRRLSPLSSFRLSHPQRFSSLISNISPRVLQLSDSKEEEETSTTTTVVENNDKNNQDPKILFPWRHQKGRLPRLDPGTIEHVTNPHLLTTTTMKPGNVTLNAFATAYMFLDIPLYQFFFFSAWKQDIANSMTWTFTQGVAGLLLKLPHGRC